MALRLRKDIKKSSYYVWFLGAKESQGLRGEEYVLPVIQHLIERERDIEPFKVTLQVSHKGLKIIQNIVTTSAKNSKPKNETIKHFIPHNTITCVLQHEDIVACILLLFNPVTKCPLHVHAYRCDSFETANLLKAQLQILIERPENQKKFHELEQRLKLKSVPVTNKEHKLKNRKFDSSLGSDTGTSTRESESSEERFTNETRIATLYDSLAAELRQKLGKNDPILLPPRDYDTVHRQKGNLTGIELRRSLNSNIVGMNPKSGVSGRRGLESSGGSSGIGSDHAPSPDGKEEPSLTQDTTRYTAMDNQSSSDEDWNAEPMENTIYLMHGSSAEPLPRLRGSTADHNRVSNPPSPHRISTNERDPHRKPTDDLVKTQVRYSSTQQHGEKRASKYAETDARYHEHSKYISPPTQKYFGEVNNRTASYAEPKFPAKYQESSPKTRDAYKYHDSAYQENGFKTLKSDKNSSKYSDSSPKSNDRFTSKSKHAEADRRQSSEKYYEEKKPDYDDCPRYFDDASPVAIRRRAENRQRSASPSLKVDIEKANDNIDIDTGKNISPRDRFKDAKEKFLSLEKQRLDEQERLAAVRRSQEKPISPINTRNFPRNWGDEEKEYYDDEKRDQIGYKAHDNVAYHKKFDKADVNRYYEKDQKYYRESKNFEEHFDERYDQNTNDKVKYFNRYNEQPERHKEVLRRTKEPDAANLRYTEETRARHSEEIPRESSRYGKDDKERYIEDRYNEDDRLENERFTRRVANSDRQFPKPAPRNIPPDSSYREEFQVPLERYRSPDRFSGDPKHRSMYNLIEQEHKRTSNEIAKELKRRSYLENQDRYFENERYYRNDKNGGPYIELNDHDRYPGLDREDYRLSKSTLDLDKSGKKLSPRAMAKSTLELDQNYDAKLSKNQQQQQQQQQQKALKNAAGYRHSYAEPKLRLERMGGKKLFPDMLHRTNSTVSNSGRVGIASIHPY